MDQDESLFTAKARTWPAEKALPLAAAAAAAFGAGRKRRSLRSALRAASGPFKRLGFAFGYVGMFFFVLFFYYFFLSRVRKAWFADDLVFW